MNKKAMAIAVAGALAAPGVALAQTSTVQIGGSIHLIYVHSSTAKTGSNSSGTITPAGAFPGAQGVAGFPTDPTSGSHDNLHTSEPQMFVRGEENLGGGMSVWFQCTSTIDVLGVAVSGLCARNSAIGFKGAFGNIFFGTWDDPSKTMYGVLRGWWGLNNVFAGAGPLLFNGAPSNVVNGGAGFHRRAARNINWHSPTWSGFQVMGSFSPTNEQTSGVSAYHKQRLWNVAATFTSGPLYLGAGYTRHKNFNPAGCVAQTAFTLAGQLTVGAATFAATGVISIGSLPMAGPVGCTIPSLVTNNTGMGTTATGLPATFMGSESDNWTVGASYTFGGVFRIAAAYNRNEYDVTDSGAVLSILSAALGGPAIPAANYTLKNHGWAVYADWQIAGPHSLKLQYINQSDTTGTSPFSMGNYSSNLFAGGLGTGAKVYGFNYAYAFSKRTVGYLGYNKLKNDGGASFAQGIAAASMGDSQSVAGAGLRHSF